MVTPVVPVDIPSRHWSAQLSPLVKYSRFRPLLIDIDRLPIYSFFILFFLSALCFLPRGTRQSLLCPMHLPSVFTNFVLVTPLTTRSKVTLLSSVELVGVP